MSSTAEILRKFEELNAALIGTGLSEAELEVGVSELLKPVFANDEAKARGWHWIYSFVGTNEPESDHLSDETPTSFQPR